MRARFQVQKKKSPPFFRCCLKFGVMASSSRVDEMMGLLDPTGQLAEFSRKERIFEDQVRQLINEKKAREVLEVLTAHRVRTDLLWICPHQDLLNDIFESVRQAKLRGIWSVGFGTGLLEWLIVELYKIDVIGFERQETRRRPAFNPELIPTRFVQDEEDVPEMPEESYALMQCYGYSDGVLDQYLRVLQNKAGPKMLILLGSKEGRTRPRPDRFCELFPEWHVHLRKIYPEDNDLQLFVYRRE